MPSATNAVNVTSAALRPSIEGACTVRRNLLWAALAFCSPALSNCSPVVRRDRYRLFVEIEVNGRRYSGHGVREVVLQKQIGWPDQTNLLVRRTYGEAFWIDVPGKPTLFIILPAYNGFEVEDWRPDRQLATRNSSNQFSGDRHSLPNAAELMATDLPALVYFENILDASSARLVDPLDLRSVYGPGARVTRSSLTNTREPLSHGLKSKVPWFSQEYTKARKGGLVVGAINKYEFRFNHFYARG